MSVLIWIFQLNKSIYLAIKKFINNGKDIFLLVACLVTCTTFIGCQEMPKEIILTKPLIKLTNDIKETIEQLKPGLKLSTAFMPEGTTDPKYADIFFHSIVLDMVS
jgi:hypothetical protein